jgi:hypothetical protein
LLDANGLCWRLQLDAVEVEMKRSHLLESGLGLHEDAVAVELDVTRDLKVILLLAHKGVVGVGEVEAFVGVDTKVR